MCNDCNLLLHILQSLFINPTDLNRGLGTMHSRIIWKLGRRGRLWQIYKNSLEAFLESRTLEKHWKWTEGRGGMTVKEVISESSFSSSMVNGDVSELKNLFCCCFVIETSSILTIWRVASWPSLYHKAKAKKAEQNHWMQKLFSSTFIILRNRKRYGGSLQNAISMEREETWHDRVFSLWGLLKWS